jgi:cardiolipin synthase (CMP-forming)
MDGPTNEPADGASSAERGSTAILTIPNVISSVRILTIPAFVALIVGDGTAPAGIVLFAVVAATDWIDGAIARRTGQVSRLGTILDPVADRLAIAAGLIALVVAGAVPLWAALLVVARDGVVLLVGALALGLRGIRVEVRSLGKIATFGLMVSVTGIAWGHFDVPLSATATALGWLVFPVALVEYYVATAMYVGDLRRALATER